MTIYAYKGKKKTKIYRCISCRKEPTVIGQLLYCSNFACGNGGPPLKDIDTWQKINNPKRGTN